MRLAAIALMLGILLFGCAQQAGQAPNAPGNVTAPGISAQPPAAQPGTPPADANHTAKAPPSDGVTATFTIHIKNFAFEPLEVTVPAGAKVVWVNDDSVPHKIDGGAAFGSSTLANGATYGKVLSEPGTYPYSCAIHPSMQGKIVVQ